MESRKRTPAIISVALGLALLAVAALALRPVILKRCYLWQLRLDRSQAIEGLLALGEGEAVEAWCIERLAAAGANERRLAAAKLGAMRSVKAIPELMEAFRRESFCIGPTALMAGEDSQFSFSAFAEALVEIGPPAIPHLIAALGEGRLSWEASAALSRIGAPAVPALMEALERLPASRRFHAASALGKIGPEAVPAVPALAAAFREPGSEGRQFIAIALGEIGPGAREAVPDLIRTLEDPGDEELVRCWAAKALAGIGERSTEVIAALHEAARDSRELVQNCAREALEKLQGE